MIGTGYELLYYFTFDHNAREKLGFDHHHMRKVRERIVAKNFSEETLTEMLEKCGCHKLRSKYVVPAVLRNKKGNKIYDERTVLYAIKQEDYPEFDIKHIQSRIAGENCLPDKKVIHKIVRRGNFKILAERITLDSVWEYTPIYDSVVCRSGLGRIIGDGF